MRRGDLCERLIRSEGGNEKVKLETRLDRHPEKILG
jgi:hypothetical protein